MYSAHNEEKPVVAERFLRTLKSKFYKYMAAISKNVCIDKFINYNRYHSTIKIKPVDVKSSTYIESNIEKSRADPKFKVRDHERISNYKNIFAKGYVPNWSKTVFGLKKM